MHASQGASQVRLFWCPNLEDNSDIWRMSTYWEMVVHIYCLMHSSSCVLSLRKVPCFFNQQGQEIYPFYASGYELLGTRDGTRPPGDILSWEEYTISGPHRPGRLPKPVASNRPPDKSSLLDSSWVHENCAQFFINVYLNRKIMKFSGVKNR